MESRVKLTPSPSSAILRKKKDVSVHGTEFIIEQ